MVMKALWFSIAISIFGAAQVQSDLIVNTKLGKVQGSRIKTATGKYVEAFLGIPYAEPPVGQARFLPPTEKQPWLNDILLADSLPNSCSQHVPFNSTRNAALNRWILQTNISEDCLYLNIWVPDPQPSMAAVMVWIHGGAFRSGSISVAKYNGAILAAEENVIVVAINYRLSIFGFLQIPDTEVKGNMGLLDQVEALRWVQENIESFGGDKQKVTIFGESAGGMSVNLHLLSEKSKNLFTSSIIQSGPISAAKFMSNEKVRTKAIAKMMKDLNCSTSETDNDIVNCLRAIKEELLISSMPEEILFLFVPVVDGEFLTNDYEILMQQKQFQNGSVLLGTTSEDGTILAVLLHKNIFRMKEHFNPQPIDLKFLVREMFPDADGLVHDAITFFYKDFCDSDDSIRESAVKMVTDLYMVCGTNELARHLTEAGRTVFKYQFSQIPSNSPYPKWMGSTHADEIDYEFGHPFDPSSGFSNQEMKLSKKIMHYWANFAKHGNPNGKSPSHPDLFPWPQFSIYHQEYIDLSSNITSAKGLRTQKCAFWDKAFPEILHLASLLKSNEMC